METIKLELHPEKLRMLPLHKGIKLVGYRVFYHYKLPKKSNIKAFQRRLTTLKRVHDEENVSFPKLIESVNGWLAYAGHANTFKFRKNTQKYLLQA